MDYSQFKDYGEYLDYCAEEAARKYEQQSKELEGLSKKAYKDIDKMESVFNSYGGLLKNRTDHGRLMEMKDSLSPLWWQWVEWNEKRLCIAFKPEYSVNERLNSKYHLKLNKYDKTRNSGADQSAQHRKIVVRVAA